MQGGIGERSAGFAARGRRRVLVEAVGKVGPMDGALAEFHANEIAAVLAMPAIDDFPASLDCIGD